MTKKLKNSELLEKHNMLCHAKMASYSIVRSGQVELNNPAIREYKNINLHWQMSPCSHILAQTCCSLRIEFFGLKRP